MNASKLTWYIARSGGILAWCLLAASLVLGLLLSSRALGKKTNPPWTLSIHRFCGGLAVIFTGIHVAAIMADDFVDFGVVEVLVPWASQWRPTAVAWGVIGMYLLVAIEVTSLLMRRMPKRIWRYIHWSSAGLFGFATLHGFQSGTDAGRAFIVATAAMIVILTILVIVRAVRASRNPASLRDPRAALDALSSPDEQPAARSRTEPLSKPRGQRKASQHKPMRPSPPAHVLAGFTMNTRPLAPTLAERAPATASPASAAKDSTTHAATANSSSIRSSNTADSSGNAGSFSNTTSSGHAAVPDAGSTTSAERVDAAFLDFGWQPSKAKRGAHVDSQAQAEQQSPAQPATKQPHRSKAPLAEPKPFQQASSEPGFLEPAPADLAHGTASARQPVDRSGFQENNPVNSPPEQAATLAEAMPAVPDTMPTPPTPGWGASVAQ